MGNKSEMRRILLGLLFVALVFSHNWVEEPATRNGNTDSQNQPCPVAYGDSTTAPLKFTLAEGPKDSDPSLSVTWTDNHAGNHEIFIVTRSDEGNLENMGSDDAGVYYYKQVAADSGVDKQSITIPFDEEVFTSGEYVIQYRWAGYRNCIDMWLMQPAPKGCTPCSDLRNCLARRCYSCHCRCCRILRLPQDQTN